MITKLLFLFSFVTPILSQQVNANIYDNPSRDLLNKYYSNMDKCCKTCYNDTEKYYSIPNSAEDTCGESCIKPENYNKMKIFEPKLTHIFFKIFKDFLLLLPIGVKTHQRLLNNFANPDSGPDFSVPAIGCAGNK